MRRSLLFLSIFFQIAFLHAQENLLQSGPMVGFAEMREVMLWVQTRESADVYITYRAEGEKGEMYRTETIRTNKMDGFTAHLLADRVEPGLTYSYQLFINGKEVKRPYALHFKTPPLWQYRTDPPEMKIALGSCAYINEEKYDRPGNSYGGPYGIFETIHQFAPDMMLWLGDNIYLREADWFSRTGIYHRYTHGRSIPEVQALLASVSQYAIWDDHDYGPNDSDRTYRDKAITLEAFKDFWANPPYGMNGEKGITTMFEWGDAQFFLLDNRSYRNPNYMRTAEKTILGREQLDWLIESLASSTARFKFVCIGGQVLNSATVFENYINLAPGERDEILDRIFAEGIKNVIFLTGDRHHSEMSKLSRNGITLYDFTVSPLTAGTHDAVDEKNQYRMEGSHLSDRNFGIIEISGERTARKVKFSLIDEDGKVRWTTEIKAE